MPIKRSFWRAIAGAALLSCTATGVAAPREPLAVTQLRDSGAMLQPSSVSLDSGALVPDDGIESFSRAISEALRLERQAIEARCSAAQRATGSLNARAAWEAHCRYLRY